MNVFTECMGWFNGFFWIRYICFTDFNKASSFQFSSLNWMISDLLFVMLVTSSWLERNQQVVIVTVLI